MRPSFAGRTASEWEQILDGRGVPIVAVEDRTFDAWLVETGIVIPEDSPVFGGYFRLPAKVRLSRQASRFSPAPALGGDTESILLDLGMTPDEVTQLHQEGVVGSPLTAAAKSGLRVEAGRELVEGIHRAGGTGAPRI